MILLSDGYLANGAEPWRVPDIGDDPADRPAVRHGAERGGHGPGKPVFLPYLRDEETLARPWAIPGTAGLQHRIGGIEKAKDTGAVSYDPANHEEMVRTRAAKIAGIVRDIPDLVVDDPADPDGQHARVLVLGWGSTYGPIVAAVRRVRKTGRQVAYTHLRHLNPFPANLGAILRSYDRVIVPEMNLGQLALLLRAELPGGRAELLPGPRAADLAQRAGPRPRVRDRPTARSDGVTAVDDRPSTVAAGAATGASPGCRWPWSR